MLPITNVVRGLFARSATPSRIRRDQPKCRLRLEWLEERTLMCNPGELDLTFGGDGISDVADFPGGADRANAVAVQPDGKVLSGGRSLEPGTANITDFALARFNGDGSLDASFGNGGMVTFDFSGNGPSNVSNDQIHGIVIQTDGRIVVAGEGKGDFGLLRYNTNGTLDTTFGKQGKVTTDFGGAADRAMAVALQPDGKIIAAGRGGTNCLNCEGKITLARYTTTGKLDTSFDGDGKVTTNLGTNTDDEGVLGLAIQSNGKIVAGGFSAGGWTVLRYNSNGSLDSNFGSGGVVVTAGIGPVTSLALQSNGQIVAGGFARDANNDWVFAATRYNTNGTLDTTFDSDGIFVAPQIGVPCDPLSCEGGGSRLRGVAVQSDGKIVLGGDATGTSQGAFTQFAIVRLNSNGSFDSTFDSDGIALATVGEAGGMALQADGKIVMSGTNAGMLAARFCV